MSEAGLLHYTNISLTLVLLLSLPPILIATAVGLAVGLFQALTQIQDQTLPIAFKLIAVIVVIIVAAPLLGGQLVAFTDRVFTDFPAQTR